MHNASHGRAAERKAVIRCAVYTRKSSEEGLEQEFNSLDAQREACEAYVLSQKHEGWTCLSEMYDDGGISGATMERPALKRLLEDIQADRIDTVVVYKVDRLTRSLGDFAKIVEIFDALQVSFVSITQAFNTTTSMGRLTLNMLLSFAQFEREVTGERIRDKIAASKKKGLWMGGLPPLGYDVKDKKLMVNSAEAETVQQIYRRYAALGSVRALKDELDRDGIKSKERVDKYGRRTGGKPLSRGALYLMLRNPIYRGAIVHKGSSYPGEHPPIIEQNLWETVQEKLRANRADRAGGKQAKEPSLLAGLVYDDTGERMTPSHANKKGTRYRYYVSPRLIKGPRRNAAQGLRVPAADLETLVQDRLCQFLRSEAEVFAVTEPYAAGPDDGAGLIARAARLAESWADLTSTERRSILNQLVDRIDLMRETLEIHMLPSRLPRVLLDQNNHQYPAPPKDDNERRITLSVRARLKRTGMEIRLLINGSDGSARKKPDHSLCRLLAQAHQYQAMVMRNNGKTMAELATEAGVGGSYFTQVLRLSFLAPDITAAVLRDRHPIELNAKRLMRRIQLPIDWEKQRALLGTA